MVPTIHFNYRFFEVEESDGTRQVCLLFSSTFRLIMIYMTLFIDFLFNCSGGLEEALISPLITSMRMTLVIFIGHSRKLVMPMTKHTIKSLKLGVMIISTLHIGVRQSLLV